jgi:hypothetical protein
VTKFSSGEFKGGLGESGPSDLDARSAPSILDGNGTMGTKRIGSRMGEQRCSTMASRQPMAWGAAGLGAMANGKWHMVHGRWVTAERLLWLAYFL